MLNKMDSIKIKEFKQDHIKEVLKLWRDTPEVFLHDNGEDSEEGIAIFLKRNRGFSFIALNNDHKIIGAMLCGHDGRRGFIHHLVVSTHYRNKGSGKQLINKGFTKLHDSGILKCLLFVLKDNDLAIEFYGKNGWSEENMINTYSKIIR
jgi:putative acetyltransferase